MALRIEPSHPNETASPFWQVFNDDQFLCVANIRYQDGRIQNTKLGSLTKEQCSEVEAIYSKTVTNHQEWCDLYNCGIECNCDYGLSKDSQC